MEITRLKLKPSERQRLEQMISSKIMESRRGMEKLFRRMKEWDRFYKHNIPPKNSPWIGCSNVNVPLTQWVVDTYQAHIADAILSTKPMVRVLPPTWMTDEDAKERAYRVEQLLEFMLREVMHVDTEFIQFINISLRNPVGLTKLAWREDYRKVRFYAEPDSDETEVVEMFAPKYIGAKLEIVDLRNFVVYPLTARTIDEAYLVGDRYRIHIDEMRARIKSGYYDKEAEELLDIPSNELNSPYDLHDEEQLDFAGIEKLDYDEYWLWEVIIPYDPNGDGVQEDCVFTIEASTWKIIRATTYPYFHGRRYYLQANLFPYPESFFGGCIPQILEHMQREINTIHNQRTDAASLAISPPFVRRIGSSMGTEAIEWRPGAVIDVTQVDDIKQIVVSPMIPGMEIEQMDRDYAERASAVNDIALGRTVQGDKTFGEVALAAQKSGARLDEIVRRMQLATAEMARQLVGSYGLLYQFLGSRDLERFGLTRSDLTIDWQFIPTGNVGAADKAQQRETAAFLYNVLIQNPLVGQDPLRLYHLTSELLQSLDKYDIESYIGSKEELVRQMQQQQAMTEQQAALEQQAAMGQQVAGQPMQLQQPQQPQQPMSPESGAGYGYK